MPEESHAQNRTRSFLHWEAYWPGLELTYDDVYYQRGGVRVFLFGTGQAAVQIVDDRDQEARYEIRLSKERVRRLLDVLIREDLLEQRDSAYRSEYGEYRRTIEVVTESGMWKSVGLYARQREPRFEAVEQEFLALRDEAVMLPATYEGKYVSSFKPKQGGSLPAFRCRKWLFDWRFWHPRELLRGFGEFLFVLFAFWPHLLFLAGMTGIAFFFVKIDPSVVYGFKPAIWHGLFGIPNLILTLFTDHIAAAPKNTGMSYNFGFMVGLCVIPWVVRQVLEVGLMIFKEWMKR